MLKRPDDMTEDELLDEYEHLWRYFNACREEGQGINSKESIRFHTVRQLLAQKGNPQPNWI